MTAFSTPTAQYQWTCLPMGMLTSSAHLQRFSEAMLRPFTQSNTFEYTNTAGQVVKAYGTAVGYIDDIGVVSFGSVEAHAYLLLQVLRAISNLPKMSFFDNRDLSWGMFFLPTGLLSRTGRCRPLKIGRLFRIQVRAGIRVSV